MVGIFLIPMLYVVMQWIREKVHGNPESRTPVPEVAAHGEVQR